MKVRGDKKSRGRSVGVKTALLTSLLIFSGLVIISIGTAAAAPSVSVSPASTTDLSPGDTFSIDVLVDSGTYKLRACTLDLTYNSTALTVDSVTYQNLLGTEVLESPDTGVTDGRIRYGVARKTAVNPSEPVSGTFITVNFTVNSGAANGTYTLLLSNVTLKDENKDDIPGVEVTDGDATVGPALTKPSVAIYPASKTGLSPGDTFSIDLLVDSVDYNLRACTLDLTYNSTAFTVDSVTYQNLLGTEVLESPDTGVTDGRIRYGVARKTAVNPSEPVSGTFITVNFTVNPEAASDTYTLLLSNVTLKDENKDDIPDVTTSDGTVTVGVPPQPPTIVSYTISNRTITPPQTTEIDVEFSEKVAYRIAIEKDTATIYEWTGTAKDPNAKVWDGTYEANGTVVPAGVYTVNVSGTNTTTGLSVVNNTETITVEAPPHVVINEFIAQRWTGPGTDLIELYNPTDADVNLTGWTLVAHDPETTTAIAPLDGETITADGYLVYECIAEGPFTISPSGDILILKNGSVEVDRVAWGDYDDGNIADNAPAPGLENSTGRFPNGKDTDVDIDDFRVFTTPTIGESNGRPSELTTITVSPETAEVAVNGTRTFTATAYDQDGNPMADVVITWTSSNETVGTVSPASVTTGSDGKATTTFTALKAGTTMVNATNGTIVGTAEVNVTPVINGYKGKRYTGGADIKTVQNLTINGNVLYSVGDSYYMSGSTAAWETYTANWTASDLPVPTDATIVKARLYVYYTWDMVQGMPDNVSLTFNGNSKKSDAFYTDRKGFGDYDYPSGMLAYDVTADFDASGNTAVLENLNPVAGNPSIYGMLLVVIYEKTGETERTIWLNEECDILQASDKYNVSSTEATAFAPFAGTIDTDNVSAATLITVVPSGADGDDRNRLYFNTGEWHGIWDGFAGSTQLGINETDVTDYLSSTDNLAKLQSNIPTGETKGDYMVATNAILVVEEWTPWVYDINGDKEISYDEAVDAVQDYFADKITKDQLIEVLNLYFG